MASKPKKKPKPPAPVAEVELESDAWERFEALVKSAAKMGHKPHEPAKRGPRTKSEG